MRELLWWPFQAPSSWQQEPQRQGRGLPSTPGQAMGLGRLGRLLVPPWAFFDPQRAEGEARLPETEGSAEPQCHPAESFSTRSGSTGPLRLGICWGRPAGGLAGWGWGAQSIVGRVWVAGTAAQWPRKRHGGPGSSSARPAGRPGSPGPRGVASAAAMFSAQQLQLRPGPVALEAGAGCGGPRSTRGLPAGSALGRPGTRPPERRGKGRRRQPREGQPPPGPLEHFPLALVRVPVRARGCWSQSRQSPAGAGQLTVRRGVWHPWARA